MTTWRVFLEARMCGYCDRQVLDRQVTPGGASSFAGAEAPVFALIAG